MDVPEAAEKLGVSSTRVRKLCALGLLPAQRKGGRWLIPAAAVVERAEAAGGLRPGRPPAPRTVWNLLAVLDGKYEELNSRSVQRALHLVSDIDDPSIAVADWRRLLAPRADRLRIRVHPGVVDRLVSDERVGRGGFATAGVVLAGGGVEHVYVTASDLDSVMRTYRATRDPDGAVFMRVIDDSRVEGGDVEIGRAAAAADLLDDPDPRAITAGAQVLDELRSQLPVR